MSDARRQKRRGSRAARSRGCVACLDESGMDTSVGLLAILILLGDRSGDRLAVLPDGEQSPQHRPRHRDRRHRRGRRDHRHHRRRLRPLGRLGDGGGGHGRRLAGHAGRTRCRSPLRPRSRSGMVVGFINGTIISCGRINPLIATLATLAIVRGLCYVISGGRELVSLRSGLPAIRRRHGVRRPLSSSSCWS